MKKLSLYLFLVLGLLYCNIGFTSNETTVLEDKDPNNELFRPTVNEIKSFLEKKEELWYGVYMSDVKIGWFQFKTGAYPSSKSKNNSVYEIMQNFNLTMTVEGNNETQYTSRSTIEMKHIFETTQPFNLLHYEEKTLDENKIFTKLGEKKEKNFEVTYNNNGIITKKILNNLSESLYDHFSLDAWILKKERTKEENFKYKEFDFEILDYLTFNVKINDIVNTKVNGIDYSYYKINMDQIGSNIEFMKISAEYLIDKKGNYLNFYLNDVFEFRLESEENAKNLDESFGVFVETGIDISSPLPDEIFSKEIQTIIYEVIGDAKSIYEGKSQKLEKLSNGNMLLIVGYDQKGDLVPQLEKVTQKQVEFYMRYTPQYPHTSTIISELLKEAIKNEKDDIEKIIKLTNFVSEYVEDDYESNSISVFDVIETKKGDCTEHAQLFTVLARAAGFPTREVGGWAYDGKNRFIPHAWTEVAIKLDDDYYWVPADPTWDMIIPVVHIKSNAESILGKFSLILKEINFANGEKIQY